MRFWEVFKRLCFENNTNPTRVCLELGISSSAPNKWKNGSIPSPTTMNRIADYFHISTDDFFVEKPTKPTAELGTQPDDLIQYLQELRDRPEIRTLFSVTKDATKEDVMKAVAIIEVLKNGR